MKQMTIRIEDPELEDAIDALARERKWSVNQVATHLMRKGLGLTEEAVPRPIGNRLDAFWGVWSEAESRKFDARIDEAFGRIDEDVWK